MSIKCMTCGTNLLGQDKFVKFKCPNCSDSIIIRCFACKMNGNEYECPKCKFKGP